MGADDIVRKSSNSNGYTNHALSCSSNDISINAYGNNTVEYMCSENGCSANDGTNEKQDKKQTDELKSEFRTLVPFCMVFGMGSMFSQSLSQYLSSQITVLEKSFHLSSAKSGILLGANDIGFVVTVLFASQFFKNRHIPRVLAVCILVFGIGGVLTSLPHFISKEEMPTQRASLTNTSSREHNNLLCHPGTQSNISYTQTKDCQRNNGTINSDDSGTSEWVLIYIVIMMVVQGVAKAPRQSLSTLYIDSNSDRVKTGFYIGIMTSFSIFGPFIAITAGGLFNKIPVDLKESTLTPNDPRWIGAWWIGFIVFGACAVIISIPIYFFPASLQKDKQNMIKGVEYMNAADVDKDQSNIELLKDMPKAMFRLVQQPVYTCTVLSLLLFMFAIMALGSFGPKYIETQFQIPTWKANIVIGLEKLVSTLVGTLAGGFITRRFRLGMTGCIKMMFVAKAISLGFNSFNFVLGCDRPIIIGLDSVSSVSANMSCSCTGAPYLPVCADGSTYFSPCHAGCLSTTNVGQGYSNCTASASGLIHTGMCGTFCNDMMIFVILNAIASLIGTLIVAPTFVVLLRSVAEKDRSMGIGLVTFLTSLTVFLPAPIVYGKMLDSICVLWSGNACADKGSCSLYDLTSMRFNLVSVDIGLKAASCLLILVALCFAKRVEQDNTLSREFTVDKPPIPQPRVSLSKVQEEKC